MKRVVFAAAAFAAACSSQTVRPPLSEVTTTSATFTPSDRTPVIVEPGYVELTVPTELPKRVTGPAAMNDSEIITILETANQAFVDEARLALGHATDQRVKDLAQLILDEARDAHTNEQLVASAINVAAEPSNRSRDIERTASFDINQLSGLSFARDFDRMWLEDQVKQQKALLDLIDHELLPSVHSLDLEQSISRLRPQVQDHFDRAVSLNLTLWH